MLHHTRGIVFQQIKYSETSIIAKIYTELFGLQSYLIKGIRSKRSTVKPALLQHLTLVDLIAYHKEKKDLQHLKEIKIDYPLKTNHTDIKKSSIIVFLNEILHKVIREEEANQPLFEFIYQSVKKLDSMENSVSNFHLVFLIHLTKYLGFFPKKNYSNQNKYFNLQEGIFTSIQGDLLIKEPFSSYLFTLTYSQIENPEKFLIQSQHRNDLLDIILKYYQLHIPAALNIKSNAVLQAVLND
jgi:DNA repair protein RecO (recombination protein O)